MENIFRNQGVMQPFAFKIDKFYPELIFDLNCMLNYYGDDLIGFYPFKQPDSEGCGIGYRGLFEDKELTLIALTSAGQRTGTEWNYKLFFRGSDDTDYYLMFDNIQEMMDYIDIEIPKMLSEQGYILQTDEMIETN